MPVQYAGILDEHRAVRERAGLFDLSHMGELFVEGPEAGDALAYALVTNPPALREGRAHYSMICATDGGIIDDLIVYRLGPERFLVVAQRVERAGGQRRARGTGHVVQGRPRRPLARDGPRRGPGATFGRHPQADHRRRARGSSATTPSPRARSPGFPALVARTGYTGEDGFEVFVEGSRGGELWDALEAAGEGARPRPGRAWRARHAPARGRHAALRQRARPIDTNPFEAGQGRIVKFEKAGDFVGRAALEKVAREGPPASSSASGCAAAGSPGTATRSTPANVAAGVVTSGTPLADARQGDRDGLRRPGRCRAGYDSRGGDPRAASGRRGRRPAVLPSARLSARPPRSSPLFVDDPGPGMRGNAAPRRRTAPMVPADLRYTKDHEWVRVDGDEATIGITEYAAGQLGDIVFVELPDAGRSLEQFATFGVVESVKAVSDLFAPASGEVVAANAALAGSPELVNSDPYGEGWMIRLRLGAPRSEIDGLLDARRLRRPDRGGLSADALRTSCRRRPRADARRARHRPASTSCSPTSPRRSGRAALDLPRARAGARARRPPRDARPARTGRTSRRSSAPACTATGRRPPSTSSSSAASGTRPTPRTSRRSARARSRASTSTSR